MQPATPQFITVVQEPAPTKQISFTWTEVAGATYTIYRDGVAILTDLAAVGAGDDQIEWNTQYIYSITATVDGVESERSVPVVVTAVPVDIPFATAADLAQYWRTLTPEEETRATMLILIASNRLRSYADGQTPTIDDKYNTNATYRSIVQWVVMEAVKRAMQAPADLPPVETYSQTAGPYSENYKYTNPTGDLWFKKSELASLGLSGKQKLGSITPVTGRSIYSTDEPEV